MRKAVGEIIIKLKKLPEPGKRTGSFWEFMRGQLMEEGQWDQKHIKTIEKEINDYLAKVDKKSLIEMWKATPQGEEKFDNEEKVDVKEMKADITDEMIGQVMDRMDENYTSRDSYFPPAASEQFAGSEKKSDEEGGSGEEETEPGELDDDEIDLGDDMFDEDIDEEDDYRF